jgi:hypothetical protein
MLYRVDKKVPVPYIGDGFLKIKTFTLFEFGVVL